VVPAGVATVFKRSMAGCSPTKKGAGREFMANDTGHFALETHVEEIAGDIRGFLSRHISRG
jgi:hypothetical protein